MGSFEGALIREQGIEFAVVVVKPHVIRSQHEAASAVAEFGTYFGVPVVLMSQDSRGVPTYYGRADISRFMAKVPLQRIPFRRFTVQ